ncbi:MAG: hypothetical protein AVO34_06785 [Firmicutes bacterium ML8_F2]|nr:MAG: hypothetical protein AVO34_06785 [Firmicutes bacterium ML8_F2]
MDKIKGKQICMQCGSIGDYEHSVDRQIQNFVCSLCGYKEIIDREKNICRQEKSPESIGQLKLFAR